MTAPRAYCKACGVASRQEWARNNKDRMAEWRKENAEAHKALGLREQRLAKERERYRSMTPEQRDARRRYQREWVRKRRWSDPEWRAFLLDRNRERERRIAEAQGREYKPRHARRVFYVEPKELNHSVHTGLPIEPFREWLEDFFEREKVETRTDAPSDSENVAAYRQLASALGRSEASIHRAVQRWREESQVIPLDYADKILTTLDSPARLYELWPHLAEEAVA